MRRRTLLAGLILILAGGLSTGCGDSTKSTGTTAAKGSIFVIFGDAPVGDVLTLRMSFNSLNLIAVGKSVGGSTLSSNMYVRTNVADLRDSFSILNLATLGAATYDRAQIDYGITALKVLDLEEDPPVVTVSPALSASNPIYSIYPSLVLTKNAVTAIKVEFDMLRSLAVDADGDVTGRVNPVFNVTTVEPSTEGHLADFDNLTGFVRSVTPNAQTVGQAYIGTFSLQLMSGAGTALSVSVKGPTAVLPWVTDPTQFYGVSSFYDLLPGSAVEVDGYLDESGNLVAKTVEMEGCADISDDDVDDKLAFIGTVIKVTRDLSGQVTGCTLYVTDVEPEASGVGLYWDKLIPVTISTATTFQYTARDVNETTAGALLPFDQAALIPGQQLTVYGSYVPTTNPETNEKIADVTAENISLRLQTVQGTVASILQVGSDDKTGVLTLTPASSLLNQGRVMVFTNFGKAGTKFVNLTGLSVLTTDQILLARGLVFYVPQATTINNVTVPAGTTVVLAKQLHRYS